MLNDLQAAEYARAKKLQGFFAITGNPEIINSYTPFKNQRLLFNNNVLTFEGLMQGKDASGKTTTATKGLAKVDAARLWAPILSKTMAYALHIEDLVLQGKVNFSEAQIGVINDGDFLGFANDLNSNVFTDALMTNTEFMTYEVIADDIAAALAQSVTFNGMIGAGTNIDSTSTVANDKINAVIKLIHEGNIKQFDLLVSHFKITQPDFFEGYFINSELIVIHRHQGVQGIATVDGVVSALPVISIVDTDKSTSPNFEGVYSITHVYNGMRQVKGVMAGKPDQVKNIHIRPGHIEKLNFDF